MDDEEDLPEDTSPKLKEKLDQLEREVDKPTQITRIKRLKKLQDKLEGTHEIDRIKQIQKKMMIPQIFGIIVLFPFLLYLNGASLDPLYFPIYYPILMLFGWILILILESFVFRIMRIKRHRSKSTKYILTKNSMKKSLALMVISLLLFGLLYTPFMTEAIDERSSVEAEQVHVEDGNNNYKVMTFTTQGVLSLRELKSLTIIRGDLEDESKDLHVNLSDRNGEELGSAALSGDEGPEQSVTFEKEIDSSEFKELVLNVSASTDRFSFEYETTMELFGDKMRSFSMLSFFYVGISLQWPAVLYPTRKKYTGEGIYR
ncbi:MAG: hypothetical protein ACOCTN_06830 [Candidatus Natronoplasma sp.]